MPGRQSPLGEGIILDLCCGVGKQAWYSHLQGHQMLGIDLDQSALKYARQKRNFAQWVRADAAFLPLKTNSLPQISISLALHEKSMPHVEQLFREMRRILMPDGKAILLDFTQPWNRSSKWGWRFARIFELLAGPNHYRLSRAFMRRGGLQGLLQSTDCTVVRSRFLQGGSALLAEIQF
ncbi:MAG: methyltransferase domain-containing protein [candidate division KSB1 bacterium]|nr:methyltransferase domain-containing protein [candidate division KSB1 bacterium]